MAWLRLMSISQILIRFWCFKSIFSFQNWQIKISQKPERNSKNTEIAMLIQSKNLIRLTVQAHLIRRPALGKLLIDRNRKWSQHDVQLRSHKLSCFLNESVFSINFFHICNKNDEQKCKEDRNTKYEDNTTRYTQFFFKIMTHKIIHSKHRIVCDSQTVSNIVNLNYSKFKWYYYMWIIQNLISSFF